MPSPQHFDGLEEDEITWYSNASFLHKAAYLGLEGSKLQGAQTGFLRCADGFPVWKDVKLQGAQTRESGFTRKSGRIQSQQGICF